MAGFIKLLGNIFSSLLIVLGMVFVFCICRVGYDMYQYDFYIYDLKHKYVTFVQEQYAKKYNEMPDCGGAIISTLGGVKFEFPRKSQVKYKLDRDLSWYTSGKYFSLRKPVPGFGCDMNELENVQEISFDFKTKFVRWGTISDGVNIHDTRHFSRLYPYENDILSEKWKEDYLYYEPDMAHLPRDRKGNPVSSVKSLKKKLLSDGVIVVETHDALFYLLPQNRFPTSGRPVHYICPKSWDKYEAMYGNPRTCNVFYGHPKGFFVTAELRYLDVFSHRINFVQERLDEELNSIIHDNQ